jgi:murein DD-endopeptidase MepM/ murein hydrolase activator NlpD
VINEPLITELDLLKARITVLEEAVKALQGQSTPKGTQGTMTPALPAETPDNDPDEWVTPVGIYANVRQEPGVLSNLLYQLPQRQTRLILGKRDSLDQDGKTWYRIAEGYVREDVVTFSAEKPAARPLIPAMPVSVGAVWRVWDNPLDTYTVTNTHGKHNHVGVDLAAPIGTPIHCAPNGGFVSKVFHCAVCGNDLENQARMGTTDPQTGYGLGNYVVMRYDPLFVPPNVKAITGETFLFVLYAHLSRIRVSQNTHIDGYAVIGEVGTSGNSTGSHLHIQARYSPKSDADFYAIRANEIDPDLLFQI